MVLSKKYVPNTCQIFMAIIKSLLIYVFKTFLLSVFLLKHLYYLLLCLLTPSLINQSISMFHWYWLVSFKVYHFFFFNLFIYNAIKMRYTTYNTKLYLLTIQNFTYLQYLHYLKYKVLTTYNTVTNCTPITLLTITNCTLITLRTITK